jgi:NADH-quinone oxidoreductase subunit G/NADP-reducing hydrogenase subunit HndD
MPCTAKKTEIRRAEMKNDGNANVDAVLTTRELASMIREAGINFRDLEDCEFDNPLGMSSGAADIFGITGGVMEAALRTVYEIVTGRELPFDGLHVTPIVGLDQVKEATILIENPLAYYSFLDGVEIKVAVTSGLKGANQLMKEVAAGKSSYHFIEVMGCPGGCITGGGQPRSKDPEVRLKRLKGLYSEDESKVLRKSHENPFITSLYDEFLGAPNSHKSHELLHTHYVKRGVFNELNNEKFIAKESDTQKLLRPTSIMSDSLEDTRVKDRKDRDETESIRVLALEAENTRLKGELSDALETVELFKKVLSDYAEKHK